MTKTKVGGFMSDNPKTNAEFINEQIAKNQTIIKQQKQIDGVVEGSLLLIAEIEELQRDFYSVRQLVISLMENVK